MQVPQPSVWNVCSLLPRVTVTRVTDLSVFVPREKVHSELQKQSLYVVPASVDVCKIKVIDRKSVV